MVEDILSDNSMERIDRIERLESILAAATQHALTPTSTASPANLNQVVSSSSSSNKVDAETQVYFLVQHHLN